MGDLSIDCPVLLAVPCLHCALLFPLVPAVVPMQLRSLLMLPCQSHLQVTMLQLYMCIAMCGASWCGELAL